MNIAWGKILAEILIASGGLVILSAGAFKRQRAQKWLFAPALVFPAAAIAVSLFLPGHRESLSGMLDSGAYAGIFSVTIFCIGILSVLFSLTYSRERGFANDTYHAALLFSVLGMDLVIKALSWLVFFLGLELMSLSLYILAAIRKEDGLSGEAGLKYLVTGAVGSAFLTFGIGIWIPGQGPCPRLRDYLSKPDTDTPVLLVSVAFILIGIGFKISMVPFHLWTPDVYQGSPAPVTAFLASGSKVSVFAFLIRFCFYLPDSLWTEIKPAFWGAALVTLVVGTVTAIGQRRVKRLLAYSSIAQMGYLLMTLLAVKQSSALLAMTFYLLVYAAMDLGAFGISAACPG